MKHLQAKVGAMTEERDALAKKRKVLALEVQCMPSSAEDAKHLRACVVQSEKASWMKTS